MFFEQPILPCRSLLRAVNCKVCCSSLAVPPLSLRSLPFAVRACLYGAALAASRRSLAPPFLCPLCSLSLSLVVPPGIPFRSLRSPPFLAAFPCVFLLLFGFYFIVSFFLLKKMPYWHLLCVWHNICIILIYNNIVTHFNKRNHE